VITLCGVAREGRGKWEHASQDAGLGGASTHFIQILKNVFFSKNLGQIMPKNAHFLEKKL